MLHEPTLRMKQMADERVHLRMQVVRELFGLEESVDGVDAPGQLADVRPLRRQGPAA